MLARRVDLLDDRDAEGGGLAGAGLRLADQVLAGAQWADGAGLDLGRAVKPIFSMARAMVAGSSISPKR